MTMKNMNINLADISGRELSNREKLSLRGGDMPVGKCCECGCCWWNQGGSSDATNQNVNYNDNLYSNCSVDPEGINFCMIELESGPTGTDTCNRYNPDPQ